MKENILHYRGTTVPVYTLNTVVVGTGAAGLNAADRLYDLGQKDIAIVTEGMNTGTSRNTGSDKQTYYKLTLAGGEPDSVREMARTLFEGRCTDGDNALCEAALSAQGFLRLVELGVPFPRNRYGEYIGYKTDHDPRRRATSVGPYTSRRMTECLEAAVRKKDIPVFDRCQAIRIIAEEGRLRGLLCLDLESGQELRFVAFHCKNVIYATGGPAGIYADSVYPAGHLGGSGAAFEAGAAGQNLTEWQYGLASVAPRWNVSGTYMQALPRFVSTDNGGGDEREFLWDFFSDPGELLTMVFLKGYQWPFDVRKVEAGSSVIDILVHLEQKKGRRVFLDYRANPGGGEPDFSALSPEAREYLERAGACMGTPLERLAHMNSPAVEFYLERGVDLAQEPLEIALCAQHNNGGLAVDCWWQTTVEGLFAAGEAAGTHGVYRPGGSALNAGQVGSTRAAQFIAARRPGLPQTGFDEALAPALDFALDLAERTVRGGDETLSALWRETTLRMSRSGGPIRDLEEIGRAVRAVRKELEQFSGKVRVPAAEGLGKVFRLWDILTAQMVYLQAMQDYAARGGRSRGSALYTDPNGKKPYRQLPDIFTFSLDEGGQNLIQETRLKNGECIFSWREARPIPGDEDFFENVWREYREHGNIY